MQELKLKEMYEVLSSKNYDQFKKMEKNRDVDHVNKILRSIKKVGYVPVPIVVNENNEIIDGQNRYEACKKLSLPIYYMTIPGLTIEHCRSLNVGQSNWKMKDYIKSYAVEDVSYKYLTHLMSQFPMFSPRVIAVACGSFGITGGGHTNSINSGNFHCTEEEYEEAIRILGWLSELNDKVLRAPGRIEFLQLALVFAYRVTEKYRDTLTNQVNKYLLTRDPIMNGITSMDVAVKGVDDTYNYRIAKTKKIDIVSAYRNAIRRAKE